jgi:hypothetical protein
VMAWDGTRSGRPKSSVSLSPSPACSSPRYRKARSCRNPRARARLQHDDAEDAEGGQQVGRFRRDYAEGTWSGPSAHDDEWQERENARQENAPQSATRNRCLEPCFGGKHSIPRCCVNARLARLLLSQACRYLVVLGGRRLIAFFNTTVCDHRVLALVTMGHFVPSIF